VLPSAPPTQPGNEASKIGALEGYLFKQKIAIPFPLLICISPGPLPWLAKTRCCIPVYDWDTSTPPVTVFCWRRPTMCMPLVHIWTLTSLITEMHTMPNNNLCAESVLSTHEHTQVVSQSKLFICLLPLVQPHSCNNNECGTKENVLAWNMILYLAGFVVGIVLCGMCSDSHRKVSHLTVCSVLQCDHFTVFSATQCDHLAVCTVSQCGWLITSLVIILIGWLWARGGLFTHHIKLTAAQQKFA